MYFCCSSKSSKKRSSNENKRKSKRKKLSDINPSTIINVQTDGAENMKKKDDDSGDVEPEDTPKKKKSKSKKQRSSAKKFARTIKGSFRGFTSLMTRTGKTPNNQEDLTGSKMWNKYMNHISKLYASVSNTL